MIGRPMPAPSRRRRTGAGPGQRGQATVEVALALPVVVLVLLLVIQVALVARTQIAVVNAAREGARVAAVDPDPGAAEVAARGAPGLAPEGTRVSTSSRGPVGSTVAVTVAYRSRTDVPLVGPLVGQPVLTATVSMRVEGDPTPGGEAG